jgi:hypothetical protein
MLGKEEAEGASEQIINIINIVVVQSVAKNHSFFYISISMLYVSFTSHLIRKFPFHSFLSHTRYLFWSHNIPTTLTSWSAFYFPMWQQEESKSLFVSDLCRPCRRVMNPHGETLNDGEKGEYQPVGQPLRTVLTARLFDSIVSKNTGYSLFSMHYT